jgi:hypothetical protein
MVHQVLELLAFVQKPEEGSPSLGVPFFEDVVVRPVTEIRHVLQLLYLNFDVL